MKNEPEETYSDKGFICPHCLHFHKDSWEIGDGAEGDFEMNCHECDKPVIFSRIIMLRFKGKINP